MYGYEKRKLSFQMVPGTSWYHNLRSLLGNWPEISRYVRRNGCCGVCGRKTDKLDAHEVWVYDDEKHLQKLDDIVPVCKSCHNTIHIGRAHAMGREEEAIGWYMKVNVLSRAEAEDDLEEAAKVWEERSRHRWNISNKQVIEKEMKLTGILCRFKDIEAL